MSNIHQQMNPTRRQPTTDSEWQVYFYMCQVDPREHLPRFPDDPEDIILKIGDIVWYKHANGNWYLVNTGAETRAPADSPYAGQRVWRALVDVPTTNNSTGMKRDMDLLCPSSGNTKLDSPYTRTLLVVYGWLPADYDLIHQLVTEFRRNPNNFSASI